jgi:hypothetical protein
MWTTNSLLNNLEVRLSTRRGAGSFAINIHIQEVYIDVELNDLPLMDVLEPTGTITGGNTPQIVAGITDYEGDLPSHHQLKVFSAAQYGAGGFNATTSAAMWDSGSIASKITSITMRPDVALPPGTYRTYGRAAQEGNYGAWNFEEFTVTGVISAAPAIGVESGVDGTGPWHAVYARMALNLLGDDQSNFEGGSVVGWTGTNCTLALDTAQKTVGAKSLKATVTGAGSAEIVQSAKSIVVNTQAFPAGNAMTASADVRASNGARQGVIELRWYNAAVALVQTDTSTPVTLSGGTFYRLSVTGTPPATATSVEVRVRQTAGAAAEFFNVDAVALVPGTSALFSTGGFLTTGITELEVEVKIGETWLPHPNTNNPYPINALQWTNIGLGVFRIFRPDEVRPVRARTVTTITADETLVASEWSEDECPELDAATIGAPNNNWWISTDGLGDIFVIEMTGSELSFDHTEEVAKYTPVDRDDHVYVSDGSRLPSFPLEFETYLAYDDPDRVIETFKLGRSFYISNYWPRSAVRLVRFDNGKITETYPNTGGNVTAIKGTVQVLIEEMDRAT